MPEELIPITLFVVIGAIVKMIIDGRTRRHLIDKGILEASTQKILATEMEMSIFSNLKWGLVMVAVGAVVLIARIADVYWLEREGVFGVVLIAIGTAFLVYYPMAKRRYESLRGPTN
jgi:hypothetical protein